MEDWKKGLFNKSDYNWTDEQFQSWKKEFRKEVKFMDGGLNTYKQNVKSVSNIMYAHRMDNLKDKKLNPIEQNRIANILWKDHLKRCGVKTKR